MCGEIGRIDVMLNSFLVFASLMEIKFWNGLETVSGTFNFLEESRKTRTWSPGLIKYFFVGGNFDFSALFLRSCHAKRSWFERGSVRCSSPPKLARPPLNRAIAFRSSWV